MINAEQVVIDVIANDKALSLLENVRGKLIEINNLSSKVASAFSGGSGTGSGVNIGSNVVNPPKVDVPTPPKVEVPNPPTVDSAQSTLGDFKDSPNPTVSSPPPQSKLDDFKGESQTRLDDFSKKVTIPTQSKLEQFDGAKSNVKGTTTEIIQMNKVIKDTHGRFNYLGKDLQDVASKGRFGFNGLNTSLSSVGKSVDDATSKVGKFSSFNYSSFHNVNNLLTSMSTQFQSMANSIAGIFGAAGLGGMIEKMWSGAAQRQTNMLYLIHQKGVKQANEYYNEIMDIVTQLPGDDTFLTNILNMASAMDKNIKLDNLKELGSTITDYYISATMKGELPFETQKDLRKYLTTGETKSLRNSLLANEIDLLQNKNSVLERGKALEEALEKNGFKGMSNYESATNALEEFKGHFQKAFADLGGIVTSIAQPIMKVYSALDTLSGSRISQGIILIATALVAVFTILMGGSLVIMWATRSLEIIFELRMATNLLRREIRDLGGVRQWLTAITADLLGVENAEMMVREGNILAVIREKIETTKLAIAKQLNVTVNDEEAVSLWGVVTAKLASIRVSIRQIIYGVSETEVLMAEAVASGTVGNITVSTTVRKQAENVVRNQSINLKLMEYVGTIKLTVSIVSNTLQTWLSTDAKLNEAWANAINTNATALNSNATASNTITKITNIGVRIRSIGVKIRELVVTLRLTASTIFHTIQEYLTTDATLVEASSHQINAIMKGEETIATYGLASATAFLETTLAPLIAPMIMIIAIVGAIILAFEKLGEAFGWWSDFGSMVDAIGSGINRLWNAFKNSEVIQGIIKYFTDFASVIQYLWQSITGMFAKLFGWEDNGGTFDIVQSIIDVFGTLGEIVKWVWNLFDDWSNSPLGIITWLNPLGILIFHLDEIGSLFEDIGDAVNRFTESAEFQALAEAFNQVWTEIQEPFQEIWSLINEIMSMFGEMFGDPKGQGTEERINFLVEILKGLATIIRVVVIPAIRGIAFAIRVTLTPIRIILTVIKSVISAIQWATSVVDLFGIAWKVITAPITIVQNILQGIGNMVTQVSNAIKNSIIGKLLGWDKEDKSDKGEGQVKSTRNNLYDRMKNRVSSSDMDIVTKHKVLGELDKQSLTTNNVNNVRNLGRTYNSNNNQRQVVINQNFSEGSMPIDARNMTKKEAKKMFIGAFGYNRSVGSKGILR